MQYVKRSIIAQYIIVIMTQLWSEIINALVNRIKSITAEHIMQTNRIYDGVEAETRKSQASFQIS